MPTVGSILRQNEGISALSHKFFKSDVSAASESMLVSAPLNTSADFVKNGFGGKQALDSMTEIIENYNEQKNSFRSEFEEAMNSLKKSADKLSDSSQNSSTNKNTDDKTGTLATLREFAKDNVPPEERFAVKSDEPEREEREVSRQEDNRAENQNRVQVRAENRTAAENTPKSADNRFDDFIERYLVSENSNLNSEVDSGKDDTEETQMTKVQNLVRDFNSTMSYLNENRGISNRVSALASTFGDKGDLEKSLNQIGISVNSSGELSVNENELSSALSRDAEGVEGVLGSDGLAGRLNRNVNLANYQADKLFANINDYVGGNKEETSESLYSAGKMRTAMYAQQHAGTILNMFT